MLRENDHSLYASLLFLNEEHRQAASVLQVFHYEIGRIAFLVREAMPGEIRLQWWRDVINSERKGEASANPLASALIDTVSKHELPKDGFIRYLDARVFDLYNDPMPDRETLEAYYGETESFIFHMTALSNGASESSDLADACGHAGVVTGLERTLARLAYDRDRQRCFIPESDLDQAGLIVDKWYSGNTSAHGKVVEAHLGFAKQHLEKAKKTIKRLPKRVQTGFLPMVLSSERIKQFDMQPPQLLLEGKDRKLSTLRLQWALLKTAMFGF